MKLNKLNSNIYTNIDKQYKSMKLFNCLVSLLCFAKIAISQTPNSTIQTTLDFPEYCLFHGYSSQTHIIRTKDGYNLKFFRLRSKDNKIALKQKVIYLQHGLQDSADTFILNQQNKAPAFIFANKGYDVWIGNMRGNYYSSPQLSPEIKDYWNFSFDQMIKYDIPAAFQYIHNITNKKINFIGHSQGAMFLLAALSQRNPIIVNLLNSFSGIGPAVYLSHMDSLPLKIRMNQIIVRLLYLLDEKQFLYSGSLFRHYLSFLCRYIPSICNGMFAILSQKNHTVNNLQRVSNYVARFPCGTSVKNLDHVNQLIYTGKFCKFDYGEKQNLKIYGTKQPPNYNLTQITQPIHLFVGEYDRLANIIDANKLYQQLGSQVKTYNIMKFGHMAFVWGKDMSYIEQLCHIIDNSH